MSAGSGPWMTAAADFAAVELAVWASAAVSDAASAAATVSEIPACRRIRERRRERFMFRPLPCVVLVDSDCESYNAGEAADSGSRESARLLRGDRAKRTLARRRTAAGRVAAPVSARRGEGRLAIDPLDHLAEDLQDAHDLDRTVARAAGERDRSREGVQPEAGQARLGLGHALVGLAPVLVDSSDERDGVAFEQRADLLPSQTGFGNRHVVRDGPGQIRHRNLQF